MDIPTSYIWIVIYFVKLFKYGDGAKIWDYVVTNTEPLCIEFCNIVKYHIFVNYFILVK
jgi:hypothetical protein